MALHHDHVPIGWAEARAVNRANWDDRVPGHVEAYGLDRYRDDPHHRSSVVADDLPVLSRFLPGGAIDGLDVCHLQCHIGTDTVSLARAGGRVTGVDFSPASLDAARRLAAELGLDVTFVESDVLDSRAAVDGHFDVVYTSIGTICWLADLTRWAEQIAALLRPGGVFYIRDAHPMLYSMDDAGELLVRYRYFADGTAEVWDDTASYTGDAVLRATRTYSYPHALSEIVNAVVGADLRVTRLEEGQHLPWRYGPRMVAIDAERFAWPEPERDKVPCTFTLIATKP